MRSSEMLWKWIDAHEKELGIGRPYLDKDPPHVGPIDGKEYADKRGRAKKRSSPEGHHPSVKPKVNQLDARSSSQRIVEIRSRRYWRRTCHSAFALSATHFSRRSLFYRSQPGMVG